MIVHMTTTQSRPKPKIGDRRTTKAHGPQIRVVQTIDGMWCVRGSRYVYEWRSPADLVGTTWAYLLKPEDMGQPSPSSLKEQTK